jgi:small conductance mechanosensitive channel
MMMDDILALVDTNILTVYALEYGQAILFALLIFIFGKWLAKAVSSVIKRTLKRHKVDDTLVSFISNIAFALLFAFVIIAALSQLGVETTSLAAVFAAAGLAIGLALQGSLSNFAAGVLIIAFRPFRAGDYIEAAGTSGTVEEVSIFTTTLKSPDNKTIIVPNGSITTDTITNYSARATRRLDMVVGIGYGDDIKKAKKVLEEILASDERILKDPAPTIGVLELGESSVNLAVRPWVKTGDYWGVHFDLHEIVKTRFDEEGISIPFPQRDLHMIQAAS